MHRHTAFTTQSITRRRVAAGLALAGSALLVPRTAMGTLRQETDFASGLPSLQVTVSNEGYDGVPATIEAGRYHVTVSVEAGEAFGGFGGVAFMRPPDGMTPDELLAVFGKGQAASPEDSAASPAVEAREEVGGPPEAIFQATHAGGRTLGPDGSPGSIVLDLTEGDWIAWADEPTAPQEPVVFTVTGAFPEDVTSPNADLTVTMVDFEIEFTGNLAVGDHILEIRNEGTEPHFLALDRYTGTETIDNEVFAALLEAEMTGVAPPIDFDPGRDLQTVVLALTQSTGTTTWVAASLEAGTYLAACFFPAAESGVPHAMMGMYQVIEITA